MKNEKKTDIFSAPWPWYFIVYGVAMITPFAFELIFSTLLFSDKPIAAQFFQSNRANNILLYFHILFATPAAIIGPFLFHEQLRNNYLKWHRQLGKAYIIGCLGSAATGFCLAISKEFWITQLGFSTLAVLWFVFTWKAYTSIRARNFKAHRRWMLRSFALTFAFVNVKFVGLMQLQCITYFKACEQWMDFETGLAMRSLLAWIPLLVIAEYYIRHTDHRGKWLKKTKAQ